jgi:hypothetical protein
LTLDGRARKTASTTERAFSEICWEAGLVHLELDASGLDLTDGLAGVVGHGAGLGVGHQAPGTEHLAELADLGHGLGRGDGDIEIGPAIDALLDHVLEADKLGTGRAGRLGRSSGLGEHEHADRFAGAVGQRGGAADHLVGLLGINPETEGKVDGLVELGLRELGEDLNGGVERVDLGGVHLGQGLLVAFAGHFVGGACGRESSRVDGLPHRRKSFRPQGMVFLSQRPPVCQKNFRAK